MIDTKQIAERVKKNIQSSPQLTEVTEQIKEIEELKKPLNSELAELVDKFVEAKKKLIKDKKNKEVKIEARKLGKQLEEKGLSEEKLEEIIRYCEKLVELEQQNNLLKEGENSTGLTQPLKRKLTLSAEDKENIKEIKSDNLEMMEIFYTGLTGELAGLVIKTPNQN